LRTPFFKFKFSISPFKIFVLLLVLTKYPIQNLKFPLRVSRPYPCIFPYKYLSRILSTIKTIKDIFTTGQNLFTNCPEMKWKVSHFYVMAFVAVSIDFYFGVTICKIYNVGRGT
jgi:hypothetical protein